MVLTGSCTTFLPYRHGLGPRRRVPDCPSSPVTFRPRHLHNTGQRIASFGARLHGIRLAAYASTLRLLYTGKARFRLLGLALSGGFWLAPSR